MGRIQDDRMGRIQDDRIGILDDRMGIRDDRIGILDDSCYQQCARGSFSPTPKHTYMALKLMGGILPCSGVTIFNPRAQLAYQAQNR